MERAIVMKTLHGNNVTQKYSPPTTTDNIIARDPHASSSSSYLKPIVRCRFVQDDSAAELSIFDAHKYFNATADNDNIQKLVTTTINSSTGGSSNNNSRVSPLAHSNMENSTSAPEKGTTAVDVVATRYSSASSSVDGGGFAGMIRNYRAATPTASSEASWNSQSCLLTHHHPNAAGAGNPASTRDHTKNPTDLNNNKLKLWLLRRKCPCTGRKSLRVKEPKTRAVQNPSPPQQQQPPPKTVVTEFHEEMPDHAPRDITVISSGNDWDVEKAAEKSQRFNPHRIVASSTSSLRIPFTDGFTFPVLNTQPSPPPPTTTTEKLRALNGVVLLGEEDDDQPPRDSLEVFQPPPHDDNDAVEVDSPNGGGDDDAASDASSDLFEIESISTGAGGGGNGRFFYGGGGRRRSTDEVSTECYEPSEASVVWSVTTAEGCHEEMEECRDVAGAEKWRRKVGSSGNGLLVGCRGEKAVSVGPQPVRKIGGPSSKHVIGGSGSRVGVGGSANKPPLPLPISRPHHTNHNNNNSPRMSLAFAT